ncbi:DNA excision repair protein ERCC-6-like [Lytechinus pictus]|uniref:DNA excision repair protein ERCC-6-like n=1 Tax=Lytechinus pictus TaxID=7653 RepID=UPI0030B9AF95
MQQPGEMPLREIQHGNIGMGPGSEADLAKVAALMKKAKSAVEEGHPRAALEILQKAAEIQKTEKILKRIFKLEAYLAENGSEDEDEEDDNMAHVGKGFYIYKDLYKRLYEYQKESLLWFWRLHRKQKGGILGDDMGLGKTVQVVAFLSGLFDMEQVENVLIVVPVALIINWEREFKNWAPGIGVHTFHGASKKERERLLERVQRRGGVLMVSYGLVVTCWEQINHYRCNDFVWDYVILDEGHKIKNPTKTTKAVNAIAAKHRFILSGTPIQNNLKELWSLFNFVTHGTLLGTLQTFKSEYDSPITRAREKDATASEKLLGNEMAESLRLLIAPYFLRRTKADVLENKKESNQDDLDSEASGSTRGSLSPDNVIPSLTRKNDLIVWLSLTDTQINIYKDFISLDRVKELLMTKRSPLAELTILKKICDHPRLLSNRACRQLGLKMFDEGYDENDDPDEMECAANSIHAISEETLFLESGKLQFLVKLLTNLREEDHRCLVFSQSRKMLDIVEKILKARGFKLMRLDGTITKMSDREDRISRFQRDHSYSVFLLTTQVGGVGLTLTGANRVVIIDPSWNPATDNQAVDRAYRIGQTRTVVIYRLITCGTVEEKIYRRQIFKESLTKQTTGSSKNPYRLGSFHKGRTYIRTHLRAESPLI